ncbi:hypothetical protein ACFL9T_21460 [Thermodesulfobacteriota bacterium]
MKKDDKEEFENHLALPQPSSSELRGRQSVRVTFKLSARAIDVISTLSTHLGIKQKSLFDHLLEDTKTLKIVAQEIGSDDVHTAKRVQKTFVLSRKTLRCLEKTSKTFDTPRDALVEFSIQRLLPVLVKERERHHRRKQTMKEYRRYLKQGEVLLGGALESLGADDPLVDKLDSALRYLRNINTHMESFVERGEGLETL